MNNDLSRHISMETKSKIWKAAKELGYASSETKADAPAKTRRSGKPAYRAGCLVSVSQTKYNHPYFSPILAGIEKKLGELGCSLVSVITLEEIGDGIAMGRYAEERSLDGMIVIEGVPADVYASIKQTVPAVVGIDITDPTVPVITYDRVEAAKSAVRHLIEQGHERIGFIGGAGLTGDMEREKRYRGYRDAMQEAGLPIDRRFVINTGWDVNVGYTQMLELLSGSGSDVPTAVFAASDMLAISAMRAAAEREKSIPEDIAFVGLDNIEVSQYTSPPLTTVHIPKSEIGIMAAKSLVDQMKGDNPLPYRMVMPHQLIERQSTQVSRL